MNSISPDCRAVVVLWEVQLHIRDAASFSVAWIFFQKVIQFVSSRGELLQDLVHQAVRHRHTQRSQQLMEPVPDERP